MLSSPVRSVSTCSSLPLLVLSSGQSVVAELSQAFQCQQSAFRQEFASELLHFSLLTPHDGVLPFSGFSMLLEEITRGSFCGIIAMPPASTWSRARNSGVQGLPRYGLEIHHWVSKVSLQSSWIRSKNTIRHSSSVLWLWTEDRGGQIHTGPASIWQLAEIMAITKRTREAVRSSAFVRTCTTLYTQGTFTSSYPSVLSFLDNGPTLWRGQDLRGLHHGPPVRGVGGR